MGLSKRYLDSLIPIQESKEEQFYQQIIEENAQLEWFIIEEIQKQQKESEQLELAKLNLL